MPGASRTGPAPSIPSVTTVRAARERQAPTQSVLSLAVRRAAAAGCAALVAGVLVAFVGGRLVMRVLAAANPEETGQITGDGFAVGAVTVGGTAQVLLAAVQLSLFGAALYLLIRPLLLGPSWLRVATVSLGVAVAFGALLTDPEGFDFTALDPAWLPILLFTVLPGVHVVAFATLAERWLAEESWFMRAPTSSVSCTLLAWPGAGFTLVLVLPMAAVAVLVLYVVARRPPPRSLRDGALWLGRLALVAVFVLCLVNLAQDIEALVL